MPTTLEDTAIDFPVTTLNDLLEAEAKTGVPVGADEEKYRRWAFISTGAAGLLAIILAVVLITGGGSGGETGASEAETAEKPAGWSEVSLNVPESKMSGAKAGDYFEVTAGEAGVIVKAGKLTFIEKGAKLGPVQQFNIRLAVPQEEKPALDAAEAGSLRFNPVEEPAPGEPATSPPTTAPAAEAPAPPTPEAPTPEAPTPEAPAQPAG